MVNSKINFLAMDIDGTLLDPLGKIDKEAKEIFEKLAKRRDITLAIITSRSLGDALLAFRKNRIKHDNFPSLIIAEEREIYISKDGGYAPLSPDWNNWIISQEKKVLPQAKRFLKKWVEELYKQGLEFSSVGPEVERRRKYTSLIFSDVNQAEIARKYVGEKVSLLNLSLRVERPAVCLDLRSDKTGKGKTLRKTLQILRISPLQTLCIGDSHNDLEMLDGRYGFKSACPFNAEDIVKEIVLKNNGYISRYNYGRGVAEIIKKLLRPIVKTKGKL